MTIKGKSEYKVPGGKMVKIRLAVKDGLIANITITGDFFMYPEESLIELENYLKGKRIDKNRLSKIIENFLVGRNVKLLGLTARELAKAIQIASNNLGKNEV